MSSDGGYIRVSADINEALRFFDTLDVNHKAIKKNLLRTIGTGAKGAVKRSYGNYLRRRTGNLYRSVTSKISLSGKSVVVYNTAESGKNTAKDGRAARYGFMLAAGYEIRDQNVETLTFQIDGMWKRRHYVKVEARDWVEPSVERYVRSADAKQRLDKEFQKQVNYWEKRITGRNLL